MGMGACPVSSWVITAENLESLVPNELTAFNQAFEAQNISIQDFITSREEYPELFKLYLDLCKAFETVTTTENSYLELEIFYYSDEAGDRYDDEELVDGANWAVYHVQKLTPAGEKFQGIISFKHWTVFG
jgi:hypothetical protein